jgi:hypothetical protein
MCRFPFLNPSNLLFSNQKMLFFALRTVALVDSEAMLCIASRVR